VVFAGSAIATPLASTVPPVVVVEPTVTDALLLLLAPALSFTVSVTV
jgi:hypothetical protein